MLALFYFIKNFERSAKLVSNIPNDTIAAISTPPGEGGISIIRVSGNEAISAISNIFVGKNLFKVKTNTINYGHIVDNKNEIDEVMVSVMKAPKTYTCEDIIEINCHGGLVTTNKILELVLSSGIRLANPGEFTERAFLNGRIDLSQAEAVMDLIKSKTDKSMKTALTQLKGDLSILINKIRKDILDVLSKVEVNIDYPEYDAVETMTVEVIHEKALEIHKNIDNLLSTAKQGKVLRDGLATAIIGQPNVGKSSILNHLLKEEKAIVTDIAGTTRDVIEEYVNIQGVPLKLIDTAGIHDTSDRVEKIGVARSEKAIEEADLVILVLDSSLPLGSEDYKLLKMTREFLRIIVLNKMDLPQKIDISELNHYLSNEQEVVKVSTFESYGTRPLENKIIDLFFNGDVEKTTNQIVINNARHISLLKQAKSSLEDVLTGVEDGLPVDLIQIDMTRTWELLGEITGDSYDDELLDRLFSQFCLGK